MGIKDRIKFIARSYLSSILDEKGDRRTTTLDHTPGHVDDPDIKIEDDIDLKGMSGDDFEKQWAAFEEEQRRYRASEAKQGQSHGPKPRAGERTLEQCYQNLECPAGSTLQVVKVNFRRLMKKYHPDLQPQDKRSQEAALRITQIITESFNQLEKFLEAKGQR